MKITKINIKFRGNYLGYAFGETYAMTEEEALPFILLGCADRVEEVANVNIEEKE